MAEGKPSNRDTLRQARKKLRGNALSGLCHAVFTTSFFVQSLGKLDWICNKIGVERCDAVEDIRVTIELMVRFRNSLVHSKIITTQEERELTGLEKYNEKFIRPKRSESDFMEIRSIENAGRFQEVGGAIEYM